jgi:Lrp/AsnC family leucine-responsive transcriptional regulator
MDVPLQRDVVLLFDVFADDHSMFLNAYKSNADILAMKLDAHDSMILELLQKDARMSLKDMAEASGLTSPTVSARLKALQEVGVVRGFGADIVPSALGQGVMFLIIRSRPSDVSAVADALAEMPLIREMAIAGGGRVIATAVFRSIAEQESVLNDIGSVPLVQEYDHYVHVETRKKEPLALVSEGAPVSMQCYYCKKVIEGTPHKIRLDGKDHYLCCPICEREYRKKYAEIKEKAASE